MATRFELVLCGEDKAFLRAAGEEAIREIKHIENNLSFYRNFSITTRLNLNAGYGYVNIDAEIFSLLDKAMILSENTEGAFDLTVGQLMRVWKSMDGTDEFPKEVQIQQALKYTGMHLINLNHDNHSVRFKLPGVLLDPGAIGKGYALDQAALLLKEKGVEHALIHGGTSTVVAWGKPPEGGEWKIAVQNPNSEQGKTVEYQKIFQLKDQAMSVSTVWGRSFKINGEIIGHVVDPRIGCPIEGALLAACIAHNATTADAYSTAMLVLGSRTQDIISKMTGVSKYIIQLSHQDMITSDVLED